tara:strand:+ start:2003 stop:2173 length:171 start_codon:yes stop_codon:yes gene_type:complete
MAKITISWDDSETEKMLNTIEKINSLGEKIEEIEKVIKRLQQGLESEVSQGNSTTC